MLSCDNYLRFRDGLSWMSVETYRVNSAEIGVALGVIGFSAVFTLFLLSGRVRWLSQYLNIDITMPLTRFTYYLSLIKTGMDKLESSILNYSLPPEQLKS